MDTPPLSHQAKNKPDGSVQTEQPATAPTFERSERFWLDDGNIVLLCGATGFRVHRTVLAMHSPVFRDMFAYADGADDTIDGCPAVHLQDEPAALTTLLESLYSLGSSRQYENLDVLERLLHMATKYMMAAPRRAAVAQLKEFFPTDLARYQRAAASPLRGIALARQYDLPGILPAACYGAALLPAARLLGGGAADLALVARDTLMRYIYENGVVHQFEHYKPALRACVRRGPGGAQCVGVDEDAAGLVEKRYRQLEFDVLSENFEEIVGEVFDLMQGTGYFTCDECKRAVEEAGADVRKAVWRILPSLCSLGTWDNVKEMQDKSDANWSQLSSD
ncbi:hypothetical protein BV25DRAFT_1837508 [Artomyces pyxidatus]|uniref:Uncharacterized protein n=1 Tax=Artomyces pyxidatus TaxID=48021 RepID=A0ACB8T6A7_9AGAM|nr:hypothetical protein BV25DRAFT_1837508 [Artomyces pyxidatus]